jgi:MATE family multidrug resistance protein
MIIHRLLAGLRARKTMKNGYDDVLAVGLPLVISMASTTMMQFVDRIFLGNYSVDAIAASMPAAMASFQLLSFFLGVSGYINVFVAQYIGAAKPERVGAALWQGIHFSLVSSFVLFAMAFMGRPLFELVGHDPAVMEQEIIYFKILTWGSGFQLVASALSCFFSGRGLTKPIMIVNVIAMIANIPLNYVLINGSASTLGFELVPELGITGAGIATVFAWALTMVLFAFLVFREEHIKEFDLLKSMGIDTDIFKRLIRYGFPGGVQFFIDIFAFTFFLFMIGRLGTLELAASNIAFSLDTVAFLPMIGFHIGVGTMVGQALGAKRPDDAVDAIVSTMHVTMSYMLVMAACFFLFPETLMEIFKPADYSNADYAPIKAMGVIVLRFVAIYTLFDGIVIIYCGALKGAGDTMFLLKTTVVMAVFGLCLPSYLAVEHFGAGLHALWAVITVYILIFTFISWLRYKGGRWQSMSVIGRDEREDPRPA